MIRLKQNYMEMLENLLSVGDGNVFSIILCTLGNIYQTLISKFGFF